MRFLLVFPLVFLLILCSFVSIDSQAAPQSVFKPIPPWSTHKPRLKRSNDDSNSTADYDSLSLDELTKLLEETKKKAENEKMILDSATSAVTAKQEEFDKAKADYETKKTEWEKWKDFPVLAKASKDAQIVMADIDIPSFKETYLVEETQYLPLETNFKNAKAYLDDLNNVDAALSRLRSELSQLTQDIATQIQNVDSLNQAKTGKKNEWNNLKRHENDYNSNFNDNNCADSEKASIEPCVGIIAKIDEIKVAEDAFNTASQKYREAKELKSKMEANKGQIENKIADLTRDRADTGAMDVAKKILERAVNAKSVVEKPYLAAKEALQKAEEEFAKANATKTEADQKLSEYPPDAATKESEANTAQDEAGRKKIELEGELAHLKTDRDEKEKTWNATSAKVAELQQRKDKKGPVSKGGVNLGLIIGPIAAIIVLCLIGAAVFVFVKRRKRPANGNEPKKDDAECKQPLLGEVTHSVDRVATDQSKSAVEAFKLAVPPVGGVAVCPDTRQMMVNGQLVSVDESGCMEMNDDHETIRIEKPKDEIEDSVLFEKLPPKVLPKAREVILKKIKNVKETLIDILKDDVLFETKFGKWLVSFDGHDGKPVYEAKDLPFRHIEDAYETIIQDPNPSSRQQPSNPDCMIEPVPGMFQTINCRYKMYDLSKYEEMDRRREEEELRNAGGERDQAGQEELPTARQPASEQHDITEKTQKSVSGTQQEAGKEEREAVARIPDDKSLVTGTLKEEGKQEIDTSLVETTAIEPSCREQLQECTGISGPEPVIGGRKRPTSQVTESNGPKNPNAMPIMKRQGVPKRKKEPKKGWWDRLKEIKQAVMNRSKSSNSSDSSESSCVAVIREVTDNLTRDAPSRNTTTSVSSATLPPFTKADLRKLEFLFAGHKLDKRELNEAVEIIFQILDQVGKMFKQETRVLETHTPASVVTDTHGKLEALMTIFKSYHTPTELAWRYHRFIFTGDYVDRGENSLQVLLVLFVLKISYPDNILLVRGNHEDPKCNSIYGFHEELVKWFGKEVFDDRGRTIVPNELSNLMIKRINVVFSRMPLAARIDKKIFACHGCVPDYYKSDLIEAINKLDHEIDNPKGVELAGQLMWNDCGRDVHGCVLNFSRGGYGWLMGADTVERVCKLNDIWMVVNGHQMVSLGYEGFANGRLMVIFSSAKYLKNFDNHGAVIDFNKDGYGIRKFAIDDSPSRKISKKKVPCKTRRNHVRFHSTHWLGSDIRTSAHNKEKELELLQRIKGKNASQVERADKKIEEPKKDNVKVAPQREQADKKIEGLEKPELSVTMAPT